MAAYYWLGNDHEFTAGMGPFSPYLEQTNVECNESAGWPPGTSGSFTIDNGILLACERPGGSGQYEEGGVIYIDGEDYSLHVDGVVSISQRSGAGRVLSCDLKKSRLDRAALSEGRTVVFEARIRSATTGHSILEPIFHGTIVSANATWSDAGNRVTTISASDDFGNPKGVYADDYAISIRCSTSTAGGVLFNSGDRFALTTSGSNSHVWIGSGTGFIDTSSTGTWTDPYSDPGGGGWYSNQHGSGTSWGGSNYYNPGEPPGGMGTFMSTMRVDLDAALYDLTDNVRFPYLTMNDPLVLGLKSIFINRDGVMDAADGGAPMDGVALYVFELLYVGQPLTEDMFRSQRSYVVDDADKTTAGIARLILEDASAPNWQNFRWPAENNERMQTDVMWDGRPLGELLAQIGERSGYRFQINPRDNVPEYVRSHTPTSGLAKFFYTPNQPSMIDARSSDGRAVASATVTGKLLTNNGLSIRTEEDETLVWAELNEPDTTSGRALGGDCTVYGDVGGGPMDDWNTKMKVVQRVLSTRTYMGKTQIAEDIKRYVRKNPLKMPGHGWTNVPPPWGPAHPGHGTFGTSTEWGIDHKYSRHELELDEESAVRRIFKGRIYGGQSMVEKRKMNPTSYNWDSYGCSRGLDPFAGPGLPYLDVYGWKYADDTLTIARIANQTMDNRTDGKVVRKKDEIFELMNPQKSRPLGWEWAEGEYGNAYPAENPYTTTVGFPSGASECLYHYEEDQLMKTSEIQEDYEQITPLDVRTRTVAKTFVKDASGGGHAMRTSYGGGFKGSGSSQGTHMSGATEGVQTRRGRLQYAEVLEDDREVIPVGATVSSPTVAAARGATKRTRRFHQFAETETQCERIALRDFGEANADQWSMSAGWNPLLNPDDTIDVEFTTEEGIHYHTLMLVDLVAHQISTQPSQESTTQIAGIVDYNRIADSLAQRT